MINVMSKPKPKPIEQELPSNSTLNDIDFRGTYSYADYMRFTFDERMELIKGHFCQLGPVPSIYHHKTFGSIFNSLSNFLQGKKCKVYGAPFDVRLPGKSKEDKYIFTVVQPDVVVICDTSKLDTRGCMGAPDIAVEILSPGNSVNKLKFKREVYEEAGVKEYWLLSIGNQAFFRYILGDDGKFKPIRLLVAGEKLTTPILPGYELDLEKVFDF